ncbi:peroxisome biogenesis factor 2-like [Liolophura sinensis]|uniref:peroxisome biogenesis factor 2-like n=1 Tax=Liolophura sinensis TaxID=3198878 RepID=UPI0031595E92
MADSDRNSTPALRISQLDASELDQELYSLVKSQILKTFKYHKTNILSKVDPEINAFLKLLIWRFSTYASGATIGQQILGIKYKDIVGSQWMSRSQKIWLATILIGCPWLQERLSAILHLIGLNKYSDWASRMVGHAELAAKLGSLLNFLIFLSRGCYSSLTERMLGIRSHFPQRQGLRQVSFDFMTREIMWHGFSEFLFFVLPLVNYQRIKNFLQRHVMHSPSRECGRHRTRTDLHQCAVCGEWPVNPQEIGCVHVFCYYCIQSNFKADNSFSCTSCGQGIPSQEDIQPVKIALGGDS